MTQGLNLSPASPALARGFFTTEPPGKYIYFTFWIYNGPMEQKCAQKLLQYTYIISHFFQKSTNTLMSAVKEYSQNT